MKETVSRRQVLKRVSYIMGGTLAAPTVLGLMQGCAAEPGVTWMPAFFSEDQARTITKLADIILPASDTPAASELGVPKFVEDMVNLVAKEEDKARFMELFAAFEEECNTRYGSNFGSMGDDEQLKFFAEKHSEIEGKRDLPADQRPFVWFVKEAVVAGYFTTEVGMTQIMQYIAIPAEYKACISVEEAGGRTWAT